MRIFINDEEYEVTEGQKIEAWHFCDGCSAIELSIESLPVTETTLAELVLQTLPDK